MLAPDTSYARSGTHGIAFQVAGSRGATPLTFVQGASSSSVAWEEPWSARFLERLASFSRLVTFDQRGEGRSDPLTPGNDVTLEERLDDLLAVLDAADIDRTALLGTTDGGAVCLLLAAEHPERVSSLVLYNTWARLACAPDHPWGVDGDVLKAGLRMWADRWGTGASLEILAPSVAADPTVRRGWARHEQASASPSQAESGSRVAMELDARHLLSAVRAPTLVLHTEFNLVAPIEHGRHLAASIPGATFVQLAGADHLLMVGDSRSLLHEVERFVTGALVPVAVDRVLATVLFTDIVNSTQRVEEMGDQSWHRLLERHDDLVRSELIRHRGHEVATTGDGFAATFDGPARAIRCARAIVEAVDDLGLEVRAGLHTGECEVTGGAVSGIAIHIAARVAAMAGAAEVWVTRTVKDLVAGSGLVFAPLGSMQLKGVADDWDMFAVIHDDATARVG
jgi:pimeloyl-ACP methyl ester carboxylesterase